MKRSGRCNLWQGSLVNGVATIGPFPVMRGAAFAGIWLSPNGPDATAYGAFVNGVMRNFWTGDDTAQFATLNLHKYRETILAYWHESDATSVNRKAAKQKQTPNQLTQE